MLPVTRSSRLCKAAHPISKPFSLIESSFLCWTKTYFWAPKIPSICWASPLAKRWQIISDCPVYYWGNWCSGSLSVLPGPPSGQEKDLDSVLHSPYNACICHCNFTDRSQSALQGNADPPPDIKPSNIWRYLFILKSLLFFWAKHSFIFLEFIFLTVKWKNNTCPTFLTGALMRIK